MTNTQLYLFLAFITVIVIIATLFGFKKFLDWSKRDAVGRTEEQGAVLQDSTSPDQTTPQFRPKD